MSHPPLGKHHSPKSEWKRECTSGKFNVQCTSSKCKTQPITNDFCLDDRRGNESTYPTAFILEEKIFSLLLTPDLCLKGRGVNIEGKRPMKRKVSFSSQMQLYATITIRLNPLTLCASTRNWWTAMQRKQAERVNSQHRSKLGRRSRKHMAEVLVSAVKIKCPC